MRKPSPRVWLGALVGSVLSFGNCNFPECLDWTQWGQSAEHQSNVCSTGQPTMAVLDDVVYDPFVAQETAEFGDGLAIHYQSPLIADDDVYMEVKGGTYFACNPPGSGMPAGCGIPGAWQFEVWNENHYKVSEKGKLTPQWSFTSDWKPVPIAFFEPVFHAALAGEDLWVPGSSGTVYQVDRHSGKQKARINPFGAAPDPTIYTVGPLTADRAGNVYYNAIKIDPANPFVSDAQGWIVKVDHKGHVTTADYAKLVPESPRPDEQCVVGYPYPKYKPPFPPLNPDGTLPPPETRVCGTMRPAATLSPAVAADGTIYTAGHVHHNQNYSYLIALNPDLSRKWATSLRGLFNDGCGINASPACTPGAPPGIDPHTGLAPAMAADDASTASPVALPDGNVLYGGLSGYNLSRGHLMKFDGKTGKFLTSFDFGWDVTPAVWAHDGTYSIITKDNHYNFDKDGNDAGPYYITRLDANLKPEWSFLSTNHDSCTRAADGTVSCVTDHPGGFEWCINAPAVDFNGTTYANGEDGVLYAIDKNGKLAGSLFLNLAISAAYTPLALDRHGHIFVENDGHLSVVGKNK
jgi:outer membrane protein assembly factor BamB